MDLKLIRTSSDEDGIFGVLQQPDGTNFSVTLEHAYPVVEGALTHYEPKIPAGIYTCKRSMHRLEGMTQDFETFQIMDVPNHTNCLFHWGNYNEDSDGCVLLGRNIVPRPDEPSQNMITSSKNKWQAFMDLQRGLDTFTLTVEGL